MLDLGSLYSRRYRAERLIAAGRIALAATSLLAMRMAPSTPAAFSAIVDALLAAFLAYAVLLVPLVASTIMQKGRLGLVTHGVDLATFTALAYFTDGSASPFFVYFVFSHICATLRWQQRGALWNALIVIGLYIVVSAAAEMIHPIPAFRTNQFLVRVVFLAVVGVLLGYLCAYEERMRNNLSTIAEWPYRALRNSRLELLIEDALRYACEQTRARRAVLIWDETDEPYCHVAYLASAVVHSREPPLTFDPPVAAQLGGTNFSCSNAAARRPRVLCQAGEELRRWRGVPLHPALQARYEIHRVLALQLVAQEFQGRLFLLDQTSPNADDLVLGGIVGRQIVGIIDRFLHERHLRNAVVDRDRNQLARDLHDGPLQSLAGIGLHLEIVQQTIAHQPTHAVQMLGEIQDLVVDEQRGLREIIRELRALEWDGGKLTTDLETWLIELRDKASRQWNAAITVEAGAELGEIDTALVREIHQLIWEALSNAVRHGMATCARVRLTMDGDRLRLRVGYDGEGFPFQGRFDLATLTAMRAGPRSIQERVSNLHGDLVIESGRSGAEIEIWLPVRPGRDSGQLDDTDAEPKAIPSAQPAVAK